ncbi:MAG: hypothetical protein RR594_03525 [Clostridia bacterium]
MKNKKEKKAFKYSVYIFIALAIGTLAVIFVDSLRIEQPKLNISVGNSVYEAINQATLIDTLFEKKKTEYESPIKTVQARNYRSIKVNKGEELVLSTEKISGIKTSLKPPEAQTIDLNMWKNGDENEVIVSEANIISTPNSYKIGVNAPNSKGEYIVCVNLEYNKANMRYTFKLQVD